MMAKFALLYFLLNNTWDFSLKGTYRMTNLVVFLFQARGEKNKQQAAVKYKKLF